MKEIVIIRKDIKYPRLTISKEQIRIKFPLNYIDEKSVMSIFEEIIKDNVDIIYTLRGQLKDGVIKMHSDNFKIVKEYGK